MKTYSHTPKEILLGEHESSDFLIASIYKNTDLIIKAQTAIKNCKHPLLQFCTIAFYNKRRLLLHTQSNAVYSKFRFEKANMLVEIKRQIFFSSLIELNLKLCFDTLPHPEAQAMERQYLTKTNTEKFVHLQKSSNNKALNSALENFIRKHGRT